MYKHCIYAIFCVRYVEPFMRTVTKLQRDKIGITWFITRNNKRGWNLKVTKGKTGGFQKLFNISPSSHSAFDDHQRSLGAVGNPSPHHNARSAPPILLQNTGIVESSPSPSQHPPAPVWPIQAYAAFICEEDTSPHLKSPSPMELGPSETSSTLLIS